MRPASSSGASTFIMRKRSLSSASPPAVGKRSTGCPACPQRHARISCPIRGEYQRVLTFSATSALRPRREHEGATRGPRIMAQERDKGKRHVRGTRRSQRPARRLLAAGGEAGRVV